ncbi:MAG TPA: hypothetical protein VIN08_27375 [Ohtaekwangia sp.]|uniref:hypothetical protein n=1 Tax=Ohtaekwangia sp. TaxID=2066019 RepID=UPI002F92F84F
MNLNRVQKIVVIIITFIPFLLIPYIFFNIFYFIIDIIQANESGTSPDSIAISGILSFLFPIIILSLLSLGLHIFYIIHAAMNTYIDQTERIVWILLFIFFGTITFIIYWFLRIWNEKQTSV